MAAIGHHRSYGSLLLDACWASSHLEAMAGVHTHPGRLLHQQAPADPDIQARLRCYQVRIGLDEIYGHGPTIPTPTPTG